LNTGGPTVTVSPHSSETLENMVQHRMNTIDPTSAQLLTTNMASRLATASISPLLRSAAQRT
jgi:hypothetical protein